MKKRIALSVLMFLCTCTLCTTTVNAASIYEKGVTAEGISYVTYDTTTRSSIGMYASFYRHTMQTIYNGIVVPSDSLTVTKIVSGVTYRGTLYLQSYYIENNKTYANYSGVLYPVD